MKFIKFLTLLLLCINLNKAKAIGGFFDGEIIPDNDNNATYATLMNSLNNNLTKAQMELAIAVDTENVTQVRDILIQNPNLDVDVSVNNFVYIPILHMAVSATNKFRNIHTCRKIVKLLLDHGARAGLKSGAILLATTDGETIKMLLNKGANINAQDKNGNTPMHLFIKNNMSKSMIAHLLAYDIADVSIKNINDETALDMARRLYRNSEYHADNFAPINRNAQVLSDYHTRQLMLEEQAEALFTPIIENLTNNNPQEVIRLIKNNKFLASQLRDSVNNNLLHLAIKYNAEKVIKYLLNDQNYHI